MKKIKVSAIQYEPIKSMVDENIKSLTSLIIEASENKADLIVLPEMATTGYLWQGRREIEPYVEAIPGKTTDIISAITKKYNNYVVIGMAERDENDLYYNSAALIGPKGHIGTYRKVHSFVTDPMWAKDGDDGFFVFDTDIGRIGLCICMDLNLPESTKILNRKDADIICSPCNWSRENVPSPSWIQRAFETQTPLVISNRWGVEKGTQFSGGSCIINEKGQIISYKSMGNGCIYAELEIKEKKVQLPKYDFYKDLLRHPYTWNPVWFFKQYDDKLPIGKEFKVSTIQINRDKLKDKEDVRKIIINNIKMEQSKDSKIILFPKNVLNSFVNKKTVETKRKVIEDEVKKITEIIDNDVYIVVSYLNESNKSTALILTCKGIVYEYNQIFSQEANNNNIYSDLTYFDTEYGRLGIVFGEEQVNFEFARVLTLKGIDLMLIPDDAGKDYNNLDSENNILWTMAKSRSRENNIYTVYSNYCNEKENIGYSGIFGTNSFFKDEDYTYSRYDEGSLRLVINTEEKSRIFPQNTIKYKPIMHSRKIDYYKDLI